MAEYPAIPAMNPVVFVFPGRSPQPPTDGKSSQKGAGAMPGVFIGDRGFLKGLAESAFKELLSGFQRKFMGRSDKFARPW
ncbi:MAG TPA: hypothetical protein V6D02_03400 [Candidatus Obscuribacterales bacterium]